MSIEGLMLGLYAPEPLDGHQHRSFMDVRFDGVGGFELNGGAQLNESGNSCLDVAQQLVDSIYRFSAERFNVGQSKFGNSPVLLSGAQNLPEVLDVLQANTTRFLQLNQLVSEVLPQVRHVSVRPLPNSQVQVIVWPHDPTSAREDLAVPLNECGSGVGQVLAILYVVLTSTSPRTILVDEPQSFLHPGAVRKLIEILKRYPQHQYVFATHSPAVISASEPITLTIMRQREGETSLVEIDPDDTKDLRLYLAEIGARLGDVFGADSILWVEGRTEELCFPMILGRLTDRRLRGTLILGVTSTGDLEGGEPERALDMYNRLSQKNSLLPPAVGFIFDSECRTLEKKRELTHRSRNLLRFLPRRMYENFLLRPRAIAAVVNEFDTARPSPVAEAEVAAALEQKKNDAKYIRPLTKAEIGEDWIGRANAANVLQDIFNELTKSRVSFDKVRHSVRLTEWLIDNEPAALADVKDLILASIPG